MRHEVKKISRMVDELTTLFLKEDTNELDFKIVITKEKCIIKIVDYHTNFDDAYIEQLSKRLNSQRQREIEEYYWQLAGETDEDDEITLICAMVDSAVVEKKGGNLMLELTRLYTS